MKTFISLALVLILAFSLCACGGLKGEKAAALYPDIIDSWGVDPFGEEYALTLAKDGSCTVLDNPGTWTLDEKLSNETQVILTAKTEHTTYRIQLSRVPSDMRDTFSTVHLVITDSKQQTLVYEDDVFSPESSIIPYELALQTVPEMIGEWGSNYWYEESALILREDGTCTLQRQPGRWCVRSDNAAWPTVTILIKLDSGKQYRAELLLSEELQGFNVALMNIFDADTGAMVYPVDSEDDAYDPCVIRRDIVPSDLDLLPELIGTWATETEPSKPVATFREDGSCNIQGGSGVWGIEYYSYYRELQNSGEVIIWELGAKINKNRYTLYFVPYENNEFDLSIYGSDMTILTQTRVVKIADNG